MSVPRVRISPSPPAVSLCALLFAVVAIVLSANPAIAQNVKPQLAGIAFLAGNWESDNGRVADTGGTSKGTSTITVEANGNVLLRKDHTDLFAASGKSTGGFDQIMMIYPQAGAIRADYSDGTHVIHYVRADIDPGRSVTFISASQPDAPTFRLRYELTNPTTLSVSFEMAPPGSATFGPVATGTLHASKGDSTPK